MCFVSLSLTIIKTFQVNSAVESSLWMSVESGDIHFSSEFLEHKWCQSKWRAVSMLSWWSRRPKGKYLLLFFGLPDLKGISGEVVNAGYGDGIKVLKWRENGDTGQGCLTSLLQIHLPLCIAAPQFHLLSLTMSCSNCMQTKQLYLIIKAGETTSKRDTACTVLKRLLLDIIEWH